MLKYVRFLIAGVMVVLALAGCDTVSPNAPASTAPASATAPVVTTPDPNQNTTNNTDSSAYPGLGPTAYPAP